MCAEENALDSAAVRGEVDLELLAGIEGEGGRNTRLGAIVVVALGRWGR